MKHTSIDWAPYIPSSWQEVRLKDIAKLESGSSITSDDIDQLGEYPVFGGNGLRGFTDSYTNDGYHVLIGRQGALCGNINYAEGKFFASEHAVVVYPYDKKESVIWLGETLKAANLNRLSASAAQPGLAVNVLNFQMIPYPPKDVRKKIGEYLDAKTSEIDRKISLLERKKDAYLRLKTATINHAITRGLNPDAKLKDSGVEWIGLVPEHWEVKRLKEFSKLTKGKQSDYVDEEMDGYQVVLTVETLRQDNPLFYNYAITDEKSQMCSADDILIIWDGAGVGEFLRAKQGILSSTIARIDIDESIVLSSYIWLWRYKIEYTMKSIPTGMGIPHLNPNLLNNYKVAVPPVEEQKEIVSKISRQCLKIDEISSNIVKQIDAYKRLKRSLINEVVTGQRTV